MSDGTIGHPRDLLSEYLDDELGLAERGAIDRHLAACEDCRAHLEALRRLARAVADLDVPPVPLDLPERIGRRIDFTRIARPRKFQFAVPATIAATVGAVGLLIALQWRGGRVGAPAQHEPSADLELHDLTSPADRPSSSAAPDVSAERESAAAPQRVSEFRENKKAPARRQDADEGFAKVAPPILEERPEKDATASAGDAVGNVVDGVQGGAPGGVPGGVVGGVVGGKEKQEVADKKNLVGSDDLRARALQKSANETTTFAPTPPAPSAPAAKADAHTSCDEHWSDSGIRGFWDVPDVRAAVTDLDRIAIDVGGLGLSRNVPNGGPYVLVVPRERFEEVFYALRARGIAGFGGPPRLPEGAGCAGISLTLQTRPAAPPR
jgi:hypothetical protein